MAALVLVACAGMVTPSAAAPSRTSAAAAEALYADLIGDGPIVRPSGRVR